MTASNKFGVHPVSCVGCGVQRVLWIGVALLLLTSLACHRSDPAPPTSVDEGVNAVSLALDAWKLKQTSAGVRQGPHELIVRDEEWESGHMLQTYQILEGADVYGNNVRVPVELTVADGRGRMMKKKARYVVSLHPVRSITRDDSWE